LTKLVIDGASDSRLKPHCRVKTFRFRASINARHVIIMNVKLLNFKSNYTVINYQI